MFVIEGLKYKHILNIPSLLLDRPISCIMGPSGSGKTTLLRHLNRLCAPDEGRVLYQGRDLATLDPVDLRRRVVMLGQTPVLYEGTVGDNLQIGLKFAQRPPAGSRVLRGMLERVGLAKSPDDWCDKLSGGERQRLCLARVLLMDAETYLMDEPSAALDAETEAFIIESLSAHALEHRKALVIVTHSERISARFPGGLIRLVDGFTEGYAS